MFLFLFFFYKFNKTIINKLEFLSCIIFSSTFEIILNFFGIFNMC